MSDVSNNYPIGDGRQWNDWQTGVRGVTGGGLAIMACFALLGITGNSQNEQGGPRSTNCSHQQLNDPSFTIAPKAPPIASPSGAADLPPEVIFDIYPEDPREAFRPAEQHC